jgi:hypothetical protein
VRARAFPRESLCALFWGACPYARRAGERAAAAAAAGVAVQASMGARLLTGVGGGGVGFAALPPAALAAVDALLQVVSKYTHIRVTTSSPP